jgi:3-isopropylmalate/(R)-2-methylmalate dehydratase large subunit
MRQPATMFEKIWADHVIVAAPEGEDLLYVDLNLMNEGGAFMAFDQLRMEGRKVRRPLQNIPITDHYIPTINRHLGIPGIANPEIRHVVEMHDSNARDFGLPHIDMHHRNQGIAHVVAPELGLTLPGMLITCNDSHTATNGALGALASPIGASMQLRHVLATQTVWLKKPKTMRITLDGALPFGVAAKDVILSVIRGIGIGGANGYCVEYAGSAIRSMSMEGRMTICNMSIEAGARIGMIAPDDTTISYLAGRPYSPKGAAWDAALGSWTALPSDDEAPFDQERHFNVAQLAPIVSWGTSPEDCSSIEDVVPEPSSISNPERRAHVERALAYMRLTPGTLLSHITIDRAFIGSCTNSRIEDLRAAAQILKGRRVRVPGMVSPGSTNVKAQAEAEGLDRIFIDAGLDWRDSGCSMCNGSNGELVAPGERCASTTNRNFEGRQGRNALTHIMSPAMVAAAAVAGKLTDVRQLVRGHQ